MFQALRVMNYQKLSKMLVLILEAFEKFLKGRERNRTGRKQKCESTERNLKMWSMETKTKLY